MQPFSSTHRWYTETEYLFVYALGCAVHPLTCAMKPRGCIQVEQVFYSYTCVVVEYCARENVTP